MNNYGMFRGRRPDKIWVEGYYFAKPILEKHFILLGEEQWLVDKETLGMCSGVPDKHGNVLYEGDIVTYPWCNNKTVLFNVAFMDGEFRLKPIRSSCSECVFYSDPCKIWDIRMSGESKKMERIGNIFDNPELFES